MVTTKAITFFKEGLCLHGRDVCIFIYLTFLGAHVTAVRAGVAEAFAAVLALEGLLAAVDTLVLLGEDTETLVSEGRGTEALVSE